jgi:hypothetical protein
VLLRASINFPEARFGFSMRRTTSYGKTCAEKSNDEFQMKKELVSGMKEIRFLETSSKYIEIKLVYQSANFAKY